MAQTKVKLISDGVIVQGNLHASHGITTAHIGEGSNLYYTDARVGSYLSSNGYATQSTIVAAITDSAPSTLDTLNELAAALGDDVNFSTTVTNSIATKMPLAGGTLTGNVVISNSSGDTLTLTKSTTEPSLRIEGDTNKDFVITVSGELLTFTQNDGTTDILTLDHDTKNATFAGDVIQSGTSKSLKYWRRLWADANNDWGLNNNAGTGVISVSGMGTPSTSTTTFAGSVGIGTASPSSYNASARNLVVYSTGNTGITIASNNTSSDGTIRFADGTGGTAGYRGSIQYSHNGDHMRFYTSATERVRINGSGNVGIGTTSPSSKLVVRTSTDHNFEVEETGGELRLSALNNARSANIGLQFAASEFNFLTGNVGIGTTSPQTTLDVKGAASALNAHFGQGTNNSSGVYGGISLGYSEAANANYRKVGIVAKATGDGAARQELHFLVDSNADGGSASIADTKMMIDKLGHVAINLTDPNNYYGDQLVIAAPDENGITITGTGSSQKQYICFADGSTGAQAYTGHIAYDHDGDAMVFATNGGAGAMYINSSQNVGIGTTNPTQISANTFSLSVGSARNDLSGAIVYQANGTIKSQIYWDSSGLQTVVNSGDARWYTGGSNDRMRITNAGNVGIGTSSPTTKFQVVDGFFQHSASKSHSSNVNLFSIQFSAGSGTCKGAITVNITGSRYSPGNNDYAGGAVYHLTRNNVGNVVTATQYTFGTWQPAVDANNSTKTWTFSSAHFGDPGNHTSYSVTIQGAGHQTTAVKNPVVTIL